jgi:pimeloyl-ACP methyl ester carboxylesterase
MAADSPIVLIHGAFQTAATWDLVTPRLERAGRHVVVATLTGLEGNVNELTESVALDTHIRDVVALLKRCDLSRVILVGHSYAGMIITGVAEYATDRIAHLVYVDALVPEHGQSAMDILPEPTRNVFRQLAIYERGRPLGRVRGSVERLRETSNGQVRHSFLNECASRTVLKTP